MGVGTIEQRAWHIATDTLTVHERLGHKWAIQALFALYDAHPQPLRLGDLVGLIGARGEGTVWPNTLRQTLDHLRSYGLVERHDVGPATGPSQQPVSHTFTITNLGRELVDLLKLLGQWVHQNWPELRLDARRGEADTA